MNNYNAIGRLGRDFELRYTPQGTAVTENALAVTVGFGDKEDTAWIPLTFWGKQAEAVAGLLTKGREIWIQSELRPDSWTDKETQQKRYKLIAHVSKWGFVGPKPEGSQQAATQAATQAPEQEQAKANPNPGSPVDDDIPF